MKFPGGVIRNMIACVLLTIVIIQTGCNSSEKKEVGNKPSGDSIVSLARQAYVFGYPLVLMYETMKSTTNVEAPVWGNVFAPVNQFGHFRSFPDATFKAVVKPNCD